MPAYFQFPIVYGNFNVPDQFEKDLQHSVGRARSDRGHARGHAVRSHARRHAQPGDRRGGQRRLPRRSAAGGSRRRLPLRRAGRAHRPAAAAGRHRGVDAAAETCIAGTSSSSRPTRSSARWTWRPRPTGRCTSSTCTAGSSRKRSGPARARTCAPASTSTQLDKVHSHGRIWRLTLRRDVARPDAAADVERNARATGERISVIPTGGGATRRNSCSSSSRTSRWFLRCSSSRATGRICSPGSTRSGRSRDWTRSTRRSCASSWRIRIRGCASRPSASARRSTRPATDRLPTTTARSRRIRTPTS